MNNLLISETWVNTTENYICGESDVYETFTNNVGELFRSLQKEYGRPQKMYIDQNGSSIQTGWVFTKKVKYTDIDEYYIQETWVTVHSKLPDHNITYHYFDFSS